MRYAAAAVLATLAITASAQASLAPGWEAPARKVATNYWGGEPPCGAPTIDYGWSNGGVNGGWAFPDRCNIGIDSSYVWSWHTFCGEIVHEYGHLHGHGHEPGTIMDGDALNWTLVPACAADRPHRPKIGLLLPPRFRGRSASRVGNRGELRCRRFRCLVGRRNLRVMP